MTTHTPVTDATIAEMLFGLEGVEPGPWRSDDGNVFYAIEDVPAELLYKGERPWEGKILVYDEGTVTPQTGRHLARCDPDTMRSILTELSARRATADVTEAVAWQQRERRRGSDDPRWSRWYASDKDAYDEWLAGKYGPESGHKMEYEVRALAALNPPMGG